MPCGRRAPRRHVDEEVTHVRCAEPADVQSLEDAFAQLWHVHVPACRCTGFLDEVAQLIARIVVLVVDVWPNFALGGVIPIEVQWLRTLQPFTALVLADHGGAADEDAEPMRSCTSPLFVAERDTLPI